MYNRTDYKRTLLKDIEQINLTVVQGNLIAKGLYQKFGFKTFSTEVNATKYQGKYLTEEQMELFLKAIN